MTRAIKEGDSVRVTSGRDEGLVGVVLNVYPATRDMRRRAFVEFQLTDGPHRKVVAIDFLTVNEGTRR